MAGRKLSYQKLKFLLLSVVKYNHDKELDDDPQLTLGDLKKFQANIREFSKFSTVSNKSNAILFYIWKIIGWLWLLMLLLANRSYLKSQKLKETAADRQRIKLLEEENDILKKDKASLEQKVELLKEVI